MRGRPVRMVSHRTLSAMTSHDHLWAWCLLTGIVLGAVALRMNRHDHESGRSTVLLSVGFAMMLLTPMLVLWFQR